MINNIKSYISLKPRSWLLFIFFLTFVFIFSYITYSVSQNEIILISFKNPYLNSILDNDSVSYIISKLLMFVGLENNVNNHTIFILWLFTLFSLLLLGLVSYLLYLFSMCLVFQFLNYINLIYSTKTINLFSSSFFDIDRKMSFDDKKELYDLFILTHFDDFRMWKGFVDFKTEIYPVIEFINDPILIEKILGELLLKLNANFVDLWVKPTEDALLFVESTGINWSDILYFGFDVLYLLGTAIIVYYYFTREPSDSDSSSVVKQ